MSNLAALLRRSAAARPDHTAVKLDDHELSYAGLEAAAARVAGLLRAKGVEPGDVLFARHEFADPAHAGAEQANAECVLVEPGDFERLVARCEAVPEVADHTAADTAVILYTSGTTGTPKGAELTHGGLRRNAEASVELFGMDHGTVALGALPFFHAFGQTCALNAAIAARRSLPLFSRLTPERR